MLCSENGVQDRPSELYSPLNENCIAAGIQFRIIPSACFNVKCGYFFTEKAMRFSMKMMLTPALGLTRSQAELVGLHPGQVGLDILGVNDPLNETVRGYGLG